MKTKILRWLASLLLSAILRKGAKADEVVGLVGTAERNHDNKMKRRGFVYRTIKLATNDKLPESTLNLIVELGVFLYKHKTN